MEGTKTSPSAMTLAEIFPPETTVIGLAHRMKSETIQALVHRLVELGKLAALDEEAAVQAILAREKLGSTAIGNGIAFPHCRLSVTDKFMGILALEPRGVSFEAVDKEPVYSIFLVIAPLEAREQHYEVLGRIAAIGHNKGQRMQLGGCRSPEAVQHFLVELERP